MSNCYYLTLNPLETTSRSILPKPISYIMDSCTNGCLYIFNQPTARGQLQPKVWELRGNERINLLIPQPIAPSFIALSERGIVPYHREPSAACLDRNFRVDKPSGASCPSPCYLIRQQSI